MKADFSSLANSSAVSIFLYGTHDAYLAHRVNNLVAQLVQAKAAQTTWTDQQAFLSDPSMLYNQGDLFAKAANHKIVIIEDATDKSASTLESHLESPHAGVQVIIPAIVGASIKKLKALHEKAHNAVFVTCYLNQGRDKVQFLKELCQPVGMTLSREAQALAIQELDDNVEAVLSALQKLPFYLEAGAQVSLEDFEACMSDFREANVRPIVTRLGDRILPEVLRAYHEAKSLGAEELALIRTLNIHFSKVIQLKSLMANGTPVQQAMQAMRPPIFFKEQDEFARHVSRWPEKDLVTLLSKLNEIELKIKTGYPYDTAQLWKPVFSMCRAA